MLNDLIMLEIPGLLHGTKRSLGIRSSCWSNRDIDNRAYFRSGWGFGFSVSPAVGPRGILSLLLTVTGFNGLTCFSRFSLYPTHLFMLRCVHSMARQEYQVSQQTYRFRMEAWMRACVRACCVRACLRMFACLHSVFSYISWMSWPSTYPTPSPSTVSGRYRLQNKETTRSHIWLRKVILANVNLVATRLPNNPR